jgi:O-antigen/teichoic acid export membrane protein
MDAAKTVGKNTIVLFVSPIASMGLGFFYLIFSSRYLGPELFGLLTFALAFLFVVFFDQERFLAHVELCRAL